MKFFISLSFLLFVAFHFAGAQNKTVKQEKLIRFDLQSSELINDSGEKISGSASNRWQRS